MKRPTNPETHPTTEKNAKPDPFILRERATFAAGCFWGVEAEFRSVAGVMSTSVGYTGGRFENPTYEDVCSGMTGHAEAVEVVYDPEVITYEQLLEVFWKTHDPTQHNRQGADVGSQYRSAIFFHDTQQERTAYTSKERLEISGRYSQPIVTEIVPATDFHKAEDYHQQYFEKSGREASNRPMETSYQ